MTSNFEGQEAKAFRRSPGDEWQEFELLSAYLDGEVTPIERQQVQQWLDTDPQVQRRYAQLLRLQGSVSHLPAPEPELSSQQLCQQVLQQVDRQRRTRQLLAGGAAAIAALAVGAFSQFSFRAPTPQRVEAPVVPADTDPLIIALNRPAVEIPPEAK